MIIFKKNLQSREGPTEYFYDELISFLGDECPSG